MKQLKRLRWTAAAVLTFVLAFAGFHMEAQANDRSYVIIGGERFCTELTELSLYGMSLTNEDILPLRYMTNLVQLYLTGNYVTDLTPLTGLTGLTRLIMRGNQVSDITPLAGLSNLTWLSLGDNQISDLTPLAGLSDLTILHMTNNHVYDLTPLAELSELTGLSVSGNRISDITPLAELRNLTYLGLMGNRISDISPLAALTEMTGLFLWSNEISDLLPLAGLTRLIVLDLGDNKVSDLTPLSGLAELALLHLDGNRIGDLTPLADLTNLEDLVLSRNQISDITPIVGLTNLTHLELWHNPITDWTPLEYFGWTVTPIPASGATLSQTPSHEVIDIDEFERRVFELTNEQRRLHGLPDLIWDDRLAQAARAHSIDMTTNGLTGHTGSDGSSPRTRVNRVGLSPMTIAENVTTGWNFNYTPEAAVQGWMDSPGHRANILHRNLTHMGVGVNRIDGSTSFTQKFARF